MTQAGVPPPAVEAHAGQPAAVAGRPSMAPADRELGSELASGLSWGLPRLAFALAALAVLASGLSPVPVPLAFGQQDKVHHVLGFAALVLSARIAFPRFRPSNLALGCLSLALLIELGQGLMSTRSASVTDMAANLLGVGMGLACAHWILGRR